MNDKYSILIARYLSGEAAEAERRTLNDWINASENNRRTFNETKAAWEGTVLAGPNDIPSFEDFWQAIDTKLETIPAAANPKSPVPFSGLIGDLLYSLFKGSRSSYSWAAASAAVVLILLGIYFFKGGSDAGSLKTYATKYAERTLVELPDGSTAELNSDSRLTFNEGFSAEKRRVNFRGQAFFKIKKDERPFIIQTANAEIKVLGTQFDVKARNNQTEVIVKEGRVAFMSLKNQKDSVIILKANEKSTCNGDLSPQAAGSVNAEYMIAWLKHKLVFKKTPLNEIVSELQRTFDKKIILSSRALGKLTITGEFRDQDLEEILSSICLTLNLRSRKVNEGYLISQ